MKRAVPLLLFVSVAVSMAALVGLVWMWIGYGIGEAFNSTLFKTPEDLSAKQQLHLWATYLLVALTVTIGLLVTYRQNYQRK